MKNNVRTHFPHSVTDEGKQTILNGFQAAGITDAVRKT